MPVKIIVFDFDGTIVDSNKIKYDAYFSLFPNHKLHHRVITEVLSAHFEQTRYFIIEKIIKSLGIHQSQNIKKKVDILVRKYNTIVLSKVKVCRQMPKAQGVLSYLKGKYILYLSSTTPQDALQEIVKYRKLSHFFREIKGAPNDKTLTLKNIIKKEKVLADEILVVGDGESDRLSAKNLECRFFYAGRNKLEKLTNNRIGCLK